MRHNNAARRGRPRAVCDDWSPTERRAMLMMFTRTYCGGWQNALPDGTSSPSPAQTLLYGDSHEW